MEPNDSARNEDSSSVNTGEPVLSKVLGQVIADLRSGEVEALAGHIEELHPTEMANLLESLPLKQRLDLWEGIPEKHNAEVLGCLTEEVLSTILEDMEHEELVAVAETMEPTDLAVVIEEIPEAMSDAVLQALDQDQRQRVEQVLNFEEGSAGRLMTSNVMSVRGDVTLSVVLRWLRRHHDLPRYTDALMVIDEDGRYLGKVNMSSVVTGDPDTLVASVMSDGMEAVQANAEEREVVRLFERRDLISLAVLDENSRLIGRITVDEVLGLIQRETDAEILKRVGLEEEEDLFAPVVHSTRRRALWLGVNLITVFAAAWVIGRFEEALDKIVALAILMPVVASMGGIAGSQTLTLTIRGLALEHIAPSNVAWLTRKEIAVGALNGLIWSIVVGGVAYIWFGDYGIGLVIAAAMLLNLLAAAASGVIVPLLLLRFGFDPALSGAVVLTTVTDVVGFLSFLGLATLFLL